MATATYPPPPPYYRLYKNYSDDPHSCPRRRLLFKAPTPSMAPATRRMTFFQV
ncbi:hypothetical protein SASPL_131409 [Salvia splendens]|uniref:Uncharacterized protein n=1 Tax=Salvia splendens TaxID=180675 RepID=A0A8X8X7S6_SALSN|nr:hypothetical protein SASPL_131409 [Salvia splendens]